MEDIVRIKENIYYEQDSIYVLLVYLSFIMKEEGFIEFSGRIVDDEDIYRLFHVSVKTIENIVLYMYKWRFSQSATYESNAHYIRKILDLLPTDNECRHLLET